MIEMLIQIILVLFAVQLFLFAIWTVLVVIDWKQRAIRRKKREERINGN